MIEARTAAASTSSRAATCCAFFSFLNCWGLGSLHSSALTEAQGTLEHTLKELRTSQGQLLSVFQSTDDLVFLLAPTSTEQRIEGIDGVRRAAVVGVGPHGLRQAVAVVETMPPTRRAGLARPALTRAVSEGAGLPLVAVLAVPRLPTDIRHNSKIDRSRLSAWAERVLAGGRPTAP